MISNRVNPFTFPMGLAADAEGNLYISDGLIKARVLKVAAGQSTPTELETGNLTEAKGLAVDTHGNVYIVSEGKVVKLAASTT